MEEENASVSAKAWLDREAEQAVSASDNPQLLVVNWRKRYPQWIAALREEKRTAGRLPWMKFIRALLSGGVPRSVWRQRMRTCATCVVYNPQTKVCKSVWPGHEGKGCGCYCPVTAMTAEPYPGGCWGRAKFGGDFGWGAYRFLTRK